MRSYVQPVVLFREPGRVQAALDEAAALLAREGGAGGGGAAE